MEFHEKLQELRKKKGLTQEELAEELYVSRTAISKWESGRGYPNIDSLKEISKYFSVSIDDLLSSETVLSIAEKENKSNIRNVCDLLFGMIDLCALLLIVLPLYPSSVYGYVGHVYAVNLLEYTQTLPFIRIVYWLGFVAIIVCGIMKIVLIQLKIEKGQKIVTVSSMVIHIAMVLFLTMTRVVYAITVAFLLLIIKAILLFKKG